MSICNAQYKKTEGKGWDELLWMFTSSALAEPFLVLSSLTNSKMCGIRTKATMISSVARGPFRTQDALRPETLT
jgi:hypothetical protein